MPWDVFATGQVTPQSTAYLTIPPSMRGSFKEQVGNVNATVQLDRWGIGSPWSDEGSAINVGAEFRKDAVEFDPDEFSADWRHRRFRRRGLSHSRFNRHERDFRRGPDSAGHRQAGAAARLRGRISQIVVQELSKQILERRLQAGARSDRRQRIAFSRQPAARNPGAKHPGAVRSRLSPTPSFAIHAPALRPRPRRRSAP